MAKTFRENLRDELNFQDMKVKELAVATGIPKPTLDCYLSAREVIPPADVAVKIAKVLNVTVEFLVNGEEKESSKNNYFNFLKHRQIFEDLEKLPDFSVRDLQIMIHALAQNVGKN